jgi:hypothetical protein
MYFAGDPMLYSSNKARPGDTAMKSGIMRRWAPTLVSLIGALVVTLVVGVPALVSAAGDNGTTFVPSGPTRVLDTRSGLGVFGNGKVAAGHTVNVHGIAGARALAVNITVTDPDAAGFITAWPGGSRPNTSALNYEAGQTVANSAIVPTDSAGDFVIFTMSPTHIIVDVTGSFSEPVAGGGGGTPTGQITAIVTNYNPVTGSTLVSGTTTNGTGETITIAIDLTAPTGEARTTYADDVAPGQTAAWSTYFTGQFTSGVTVLRAYKAF